MMPKQLIFVDGIGGKRYMRGRLIRFFSSRGYVVHCFDYSPSAQLLATIKTQLIGFLHDVAGKGEYFAIGYSFGGVLLRLVLQECKTLKASPSRIVLLASPVLSMRLARRVKNWRIYKAITGECGQVVADDATMARIAEPTIPTGCIYGIW
jgi:alpha-beta hydrolase superfamily lysophospholipase